jgi:hypothetical protein
MSEKTKPEHSMKRGKNVPSRHSSVDNSISNIYCG